jgi:hypothetical protein
MFNRVRRVGLRITAAHRTGFSYSARSTGVCRGTHSVMTGDRDAALFARMPESAVAALRAITDDPSVRPSTRAAEALAAVDAGAQPIPLAEQLTDAQRAVAEWLCEHPGVPLAQYAIPQEAWCRKRWLGLAPPGVRCACSRRVTRRP